MIEAATSSRAKCRGCKKPIAKGELRFGEEIPGNFDGMMTFWYHLTCAGAKRPEGLRESLAKYKPQFPERAALEASLSGSVASNRTSRLTKVDRAPTNRATCKQCKVAIAKDSLRITVLLDEDPMMPSTGYLHLACGPTFAATNVDTHLTTKATKTDRAEVAAVLKAFSLLDGDARGKQLEQDVGKAKKKAAAEVSVLSDWLEEQGCALQPHELAQLLASRAKRK